MKTHTAVGIGVAVVSLVSIAGIVLLVLYLSDGTGTPAKQRKHSVADNTAHMHQRTKKPYYLANVKPSYSGETDAELRKRLPEAKAALKKTERLLLLAKE